MLPNIDLRQFNNSNYEPFLRSSISHMLCTSGNNNISQYSQISVFPRMKQGNLHYQTSEKLTIVIFAYFENSVINYDAPLTLGRIREVLD